MPNKRDDIPTYKLILWTIAFIIGGLFMFVAGFTLVAITAKCTLMLWQWMGVL